MSYSYSTFDEKVEQVLTFEPSLRLFTIEHQDDLNLSGEVFTDYDILVNGQFSFADPTSDFTILSLRLKNPCLDPAYVSLFKADDLTDQEYTITQNEVKYQVPAFTVQP